MSSYDETAERRYAEIAQYIRSHAVALSKEFNVTVESAFTDLVSKLRSADNGLTSDGRAGWWRVRCRLFSADNAYCEAVADSDPTRDPDVQGETVIQSLPSVVAWVRELVQNHHGDAAVVGLSDTAVSSRIKSLRTQMAYRKNGTGTMRLDYRVAATSKFREGDLWMRAVVHLEKEAM